LFARTPEVAAAFGLAFEAGRIEKSYLALVRGTPDEEGVIDQPIPRKEGGERVTARTRFRLVARSGVDRCSLVEAMPETGRLHQVRRHLKHISHPLIGDVNYGKGDINRHYRERYGLHRLALHAHALAFEHPMTHARITIEAPMPDDLGVALDALSLPRTPSREVSR
jgi:tRNA pseudouridine65 synthase